MRRQPCVLPGQDAPLIRHELFQQGDVLEIERITGEIDLGLGARGADFTVGRSSSAATAFVLLVW